jgi:hypothetical protein
VDRAIGTLSFTNYYAAVGNPSSIALLELG